MLHVFKIFIHALHFISSEVVDILNVDCFACTYEIFIVIDNYEAQRIFKVLIVNTYICSCGESTYNLIDAQVIRVKLLKLAESIDSLR
jgi:hypothetical protein